MAIQFFFEDIDKIDLSKKNVKSWIKECVVSYEMKVGDINYIFCSDEYLKSINIEYLKHNYFTDIITFNYNDKKTINADIYISRDRVQENSIEYKVAFEIELLRVMIHGILHLVGLDDQTPAQKSKMRESEDKWLKLYQ